MSFVQTEKGSIGTLSYDLMESQVYSYIADDTDDLRISNKGYVLSNEFEFINTLSDENFKKYFEEVSLNVETGYDLKPGELLFIDTLEKMVVSRVFRKLVCRVW